jgi:hypothetical protein
MKDRALKATIAGIGIVGTYITAESLKACRSVIDAVSNLMMLLKRSTTKIAVLRSLNPEDIP